MPKAPATPSARETHLRHLSQQVLAKQGLGSSIVSQNSLHGGGSERRIIQFIAQYGSVVGVIASPQTAKRFVQVNQALATRGVPVPALLGEDARAGVYVLEYLGDCMLSKHLTQLRQTAGRKAAFTPLQQALNTLVHMQLAGMQAMEKGDIPLGGGVNSQQFSQDIEGFLQDFVPLYSNAPHVLTQQAMAQLRKAAWDFGQALLPLAQVENTNAQTTAILMVFCHRDYQCRNLMWQTTAGQAPKQGRVVVIDHQDGGWGPVGYDVVSLLYSPDTGLLQTERDALHKMYVGLLAQTIQQTKGKTRLDALTKQFEHSQLTLVWLRRLQALGAYARIARQKKQISLLAKAPAAAQDLLNLRAQGRLPWRHAALHEWLGIILNHCVQNAIPPTPTG